MYIHQIPLFATTLPLCMHACNDNYNMQSGGRRAGEKREGMKEVLESLPTLWDEEQYKSEYDLSSFIDSLSAARKD